MRIVEHRSASDFLDRVQDGLERHEAENSLLLGVAMRLRDDPAHSGAEPVLVTVEQGAQWHLAGVMTPPYALMLGAPHSCMPLQSAVDALISRLVESHISVSGVVATPDIVDAFVVKWTERTGANITGTLNQRVYSTRTVVNDLPAANGRLRVASAGDLELVTDWFAAFEMEALGEQDEVRTREVVRYRLDRGEMYLWETSRAVSMVGRSRPTNGTVTVNAVYTPPELRGRGYATAAVAELTGQLLGEGYHQCVLYTDLANPTANGIYQRIGYRPVCDSRHVWFA